MSTWEYGKLVESMGAENLRADGTGDDFYSIRFDTAQTSDFLVRTGASDSVVIKHLTDLGKQGWELVGTHNETAGLEPEDDEPGEVMNNTFFWLKRQID